jgi:hypothetical protein
MKGKNKKREKKKANALCIKLLCPSQIQMVRLVLFIFTKLQKVKNDL